MKRFILTTAVIAALALTNVYGADLKINGENVDTNVEIIDGKAMIPARDLLESLNYSVQWDNETKTVDAKREESEITLENNGDLSEAKPIYGLGELFPSENFTGDVYLNNIANEGGVSIANVTFDEGCINNWHVHDHVQILMGTMGKGYCQQEGNDVETINVGDVVVIPAGVKHWHGAAKDSQFTHISISGPVVEGMEAFGTNWLEPVSQEEYNNLD
ncbi:MAG: stalk domain-containing protein [Clostridia bacterium]|nr:stalk domain-containing protein [Clostridia bacterium]